jgi:hypothetical protein
MRRLAWLAGAAAIGFFATAVPAQERPDFSGNWTTEAEETSGRGAQVGGARGARGGQARGQRGPGGRGRARVGDMGSGFGPNITITQDANALTIVYPFFVRGDLQPPLTFHYALDGSETTNTVEMGLGIQEQISRTAWNGDSLVITTTHTLENPETGDAVPVEVRHVLSLESPTSLVFEVTRSGVLGGESSTTRTTYRKVQ